MKIIILQYMFQNDGSSNALLKLYNYLISKEVDCLIIYSRNSQEIRILKKAGIKAIKVPYLMSSDRGYRGIIKYAYIIVFLIINTVALMCMLFISFVYKPNIIHTNVSPIHLGYYLAKILRIPHIWHLREFRRREAYAQPIFNYAYFKKILNDSDAIATTKSIKEYYGLSRCKVIYDGVIDQHASKTISPLNNRLNSFLFVGRVEQSKGIEILINSFAKFAKNNSDWNLDIIGGYTEKYYAELVKKISDLKITDRVDFLGICNDVEYKMSERKIVVISSLSEGFGYVTVEAMNNKCFVIANDNTGTKEQLDNAKSIAGYDVAYRFSTEGELFDQMKRFVEGDYTEHQQMVDKAYTIVNQLYSVEQYGTEVLNYYKQIIKSQK